MTLIDEKKPMRRINGAGNPMEGRTRQAIAALSIVAAWIPLTAFTFWISRSAGAPGADSAPFVAMIGVLFWVFCEMLGGQRGPIWPISALAVTGSLSVGFAAGLYARELDGWTPSVGIAVICGVSAVAMIAYLFRFRLPGLVSPTMTFLIICLFLSLYGMDRESMARLEGVSARGILAALMGSPAWATFFGTVSVAMIFLARRLDLQGDEFGLASARPLHLVGAGVAALVAGRAFAFLPMPLDALALAALWIGGFVWVLRINRVAVIIAIHLAIMKPTVLAFATPLGWSPSFAQYSWIFTGVLILDLALWPFLHQISQGRGWTLGPGGRIPPQRAGWMWRYWPYA